MDDTTAADAGFVAAGVALAVALYGVVRLDLPGSLDAVALAGVVLAGLALVAFAARRHGGVGRSAPAVGAGACSIGLVILGGYLVWEGGPWPVALAVALAGAFGAVFAYADGIGLGRAAIAGRTRITLWGVLLGGGGIAAILVWYVIAGAIVAAIDPALFQNETGTLVVETLASGAGTLSVVAVYLRWSGRGVAFLDLRWPDRWGIAYAVAGTLAILGGNLAIGLAFQRVGVRTAQHAIVRSAATDPSVLLILVPLSYLVIAPGEELLYRNVVQKLLRTRFSATAGVVMASAVFAAVHFPAYSNPGDTAQATLSTLVVIFVLALVLGAIYERTRNVSVTILVHGTFNAIAFAVTYAQFTAQFVG